MGADLKSKYQACLKQNRIKKFSDGPKLVNKELLAASRDLLTAKKGLEGGEWKWSTIQAYYSMFHVARALLFSRQFSERSHYCLRVALEYHFVGSGGFPSDLIDAFQIARTMRENADYEENYSDIGAKKLVAAAERFIEEAQKILKQSL